MEGIGKEPQGKNTGIEGQPTQRWGRADGGCLKSVQKRNHHWYWGKQQENSDHFIWGAKRWKEWWKWVHVLWFRFFKKINDEIEDFSKQLDRIAKEETDRYTNLQNAGELEQEYSSDPELNSILENKETIPGTISTIKELLSEKKSKKESEVDN